jgi:acetyl/propionyl-CoA carboxylase alpha subunit
VEAGSEVSPYYDAMLAKLIAWAPARPAAARMLASALDRARIHGPATNRDLLASVLRHPVFLAGQADTSLLDGYDLAGVAPAEEACRLSATAAALAGAAANRAGARAAAGLPAGWRNVVSQPQRASFDGPRGRIEVAYLWQRDGITVVPTPGAPTGEPTTGEPRADVNPAVVEAAPGHVVLEITAGSGEEGTGESSTAGTGESSTAGTGQSAGVRYRFDVARAGGVVWVDSPFGSIALTPVPRLPEPAATREAGSLVAPMPGSVVRIEATAGQRVTAGQPVVVLEAMKMEHQIVAPADGLIAEIRVIPGEQVQAGDVLATVTGDDPVTGEDTAVTGDDPVTGQDTAQA